MNKLLPDTAPPEDDTDRAVRIVRQGIEVGDLLHQFGDAAATIRVVLENDAYDEEVRRAAYATMFDIIGDTLTESVQARTAHAGEWDVRPDWTGLSGVCQRSWRRVERRARALTSRPTARRRLSTLTWTPVGLLLSAGIAALVVRGSFLAAAALLLVRVAGSALAGGPTVMGSVRGRVMVVQCQSIWEELRACLSSHLSDGIVMTSLAVAIYKYGSPGGAMAACAAVALSLYASLVRVGSERSGAMVTRSVLERFARTGSSLVALTMADVFPQHVVAALYVAVAGFLAYAVVEIIRVVLVLSHEPAPRAALTLMTSQNGTRVDGIVATAPPERGNANGRRVRASFATRRGLRDALLCKA